MTQFKAGGGWQRLPLIVGGVGGMLLMVNRLLTPTLTASQSRSDVLGVILSALLILTGLLWQEVQPRPPEMVHLIGTEGFELAADLPDGVQRELAWLSHILLTNTVTCSLIIWYGDRLLLRRGVLPSPAPPMIPGPIVEQALVKQKAIYLVDLKLYPGRIEFNYLPENTQGLICQPLGDRGVMVLGANVPRGYSQQDENWIGAIATKLTDTLSQCEPVTRPDD